MNKTIATLLGTLCGSLLLAPLFCMIAWNIFAREFNLPSFSYWQWMIIVLAIRLALGKITLSLDKKG